MVHHEEIRKAQRAQPFQPFLIQMADGQSFRINHPELLLVMQNGRTVVFDHDGHLEILSCMLITSLSIPGKPSAEPPQN